MAKRRIEITVETERIVITGAAPKLVWCEACNDSTLAISLEQAVLIARVSAAALEWAIDSGRLHHYWQGGDRRRWICLSSLARMSAAE